MKKLQKWAKIILPFSNKQNFCRDRFSIVLEGKGFKKFSTNSTKDLAFYHPKERVVVKGSYIAYQKPAIAVPTLEVADIEYDFKILVQPLCRPFTKADWKKYKSFHVPFEDDFHDENLAFYRNKVVAIDW
jgi:hypothetical protein